MAYQLQRRAGPVISDMTTHTKVMRQVLASSLSQIVSIEKGSEVPMMNCLKIHTDFLQSKNFAPYCKML